MIALVVLTFVIGYLSIVFEHPLKLDKAVPALLMGGLIWAFISIGHVEVVGDEGVQDLSTNLIHHLAGIAGILVFLLGAMTIVELVDIHKGFNVITNRIKTNSRIKILWMVTILSYFLSAVLDNLACTIVLISLLRRLIPERNERILLSCMAIVGANAGGAWSPIGDVTTTMLWIAGKTSSLGLIEHIFIPSLFCVSVPALILSFSPSLRGGISKPKIEAFETGQEPKELASSKIMLIAGILGLLFVPLFKAITGLPPFVGMMLSLGIVWMISEYVKPEPNLTAEKRQQYSVLNALSRIELSSIIFFLGILMAVAGLESAAVSLADGEKVGILRYLAIQMSAVIPSTNIVVIIIGLVSAVVDNVPLVAATMGMYDFPIDDQLWHFIAYSAGTGGSILVIGSAAGVAAMGIERIDFIWYMRKFSWIAAAGFFAGCAAYLIEKSFF